jgi:hypothetical protein
MQKNILRIIYIPASVTPVEHHPAIHVGIRSSVVLVLSGGGNSKILNYP